MQVRMYINYNPRPDIDLMNCYGVWRARYKYNHVFMPEF